MKESYNFGVDTEAKQLYTETSGMTEKRFTLTERKCYFTSLIFDNQENEKLGSNEAMECLNELHEENEQLKQTIKKLEAQLYCSYDSVCINCVNEYLVKKDKYYVSKCKKGHEQCSKSDVKYCDDFELKGDVDDCYCK